ncbi:discoidin domain containing receptor 2 [Echinococcus multilocularis]|uniref:Discoidin domain containing receptor 2 n=1 Tax=Echinococcus multilocularis TaxID=6211 RepID=A0A068Y0D3_ECHMU|nr:discoidin domain containing receptor 2 [Echinococcus multilocularis]
MEVEVAPLRVWWNVTPNRAMRIPRSWILCLLLSLTSFILKFALSASCDEALLGVNELPDSAFTATSNSETVEQSIAGLGPGVDHSAKTARDMLTGGWCPSRKVSTNLTDYIQVDMGAVNVITKIAFGPRSDVAYTPSFVIRYRREGSSNWRDYKSCSSNSTLIIRGVGSNLDLKLIPLNPPIVARWVRVYPYSRTPMFVCAKFEFYGCRFSDELVEYEIPDGSDFYLNSFTNPLNLHDTCYDGQWDPRGGILHNGVGCLVDSRISTSTKALQLPPWEHDTASSAIAAASTLDCLVGWNRSRWEETRRSTTTTVDLVFRFSGLRTFNALHLYALNAPSRKIRMPRRIEVAVSVDGLTFSATPDAFLDVQTFSSEPLIVDLKKKNGRVVQVKLFFDDEWIVLSETRFISVAGNKNGLSGYAGGEDSPNLRFDESEKPFSSSSLMETQYLPAVDKTKVNDDNSINHISKAGDVDDEEEDFENLINEANGGPLRVIDPPPYQGPTMLVLILVFLCCFMILLVGVACFSIAWMQKRRKKRHQDSRSELQSANGKLLKAQSGSVGLFRWPGLSITNGGGGGCTTANAVSQPSFDGGLGYVAVANTDCDCANSSLLSHQASSTSPFIIYPGFRDGSFFAYTGVPALPVVQNGGSGVSGRPLAKRLLTSMATKLFRSRCAGKPSAVRIMSPSTHQYEQVLAQSAHSSPVMTSTATAAFQPQPSAPTRNEAALPSFPVTSLPVHTANGLIQIDLKRSHPSLIVNGHPLLQFQQPQQQQQSSDNNNRGANYFSTFSNRQHDSSVVYQSVHGESDADSLAASTMSPEYASASLLGGQSGNGLPFIAGIGGWGVGEYSTAHRQLVDAATSTQAILQQPFYASPPLHQHQGPASANAATAAAAAAYAWTSPTGTFIQRSLSQQQFHQPFWATQTVSQAAPIGHEVASSTHSGESSDQFSARIGGVIGGGGGGGSGGSAGDPPSTIYGFNGQS